MKSLFPVLALVAFLLGHTLVHAQSAATTKRVKVRPTFTEGVHVEGSVIFTYVDEKRRRRLTLDLYKPAKHSGTLPAIVMFFGGGWQNGRPGLFAPLGQALAQRGYVCIVPEYRLSDEAPFPAAVHDCKAAIRWTRANAKRFRIDPDRIATIGGSAGGHLSGFMGATNGIERFEGGGDNRDRSSAVQAGIVMCGSMNMLPKTTRPFTLRRRRSPTWVPIPRPCCSSTGSSIAPRPVTWKCGKKMDKLKIPHEFVLMPKGPHPF
jgi:pectinesterase